MKTSMFFHAAVCALLGFVPALAACSSADDTGAGGHETTSSATSASSGTGGAAPGAPSRVASFDPTKSELPEGLAIDPTGTTAYVGFAPTGQIVQVSLADGTVTDYGTVPTPPANGGFVLGLALDKGGNLYVGVASFMAGYQPGIYQIPKGGGAGTLFAKDPKLTFPNGLLFDEAGTLWVAVSTGVVFNVAPTGTVSTWLSDPLLVSNKNSPCALGLGIGANGIAIMNGDVYVSNTDVASLVKIPVNADGSAGTASNFIAPNCATLKGADGIIVAPDNTFYLAGNAQNAMLHVGADASVEVVTMGAPLDFPASPLLIPGAKGTTLYVTNLAYISAMTKGGNPKPSLAAIPIGG
jgi:sugar lactone lactonase YvrE